MSSSIDRDIDAVMEPEPEPVPIPAPVAVKVSTVPLASLDTLVSMMSAAITIGEHKHQVTMKVDKSQLERNCAIWMKRCGLPFEEQKTFPDCKDKGLLRYDGAVEPANALIELDGAQHFVPTSFKAGKVDQAVKDHNLREQQRRDQIKTNFTRSRGIHFLRISFSEISRMDSHLELFFRAIERVGTRGERGGRVEMFCGKEYSRPSSPALLVPV